MFTVMARIGLCVLLLLPLTSGGVWAQAPPTDVLAEMRAATLRPGNTVRLSAPGVVVERGTVLSLNAGRLLVGQDGQEWELATATLERLEVEERSTLKWALGGTAMGFLAGAAYSAIRSSDTVGDDGRQGWAIRGGVIGLSVGGTTGYFQKGWRLLFPVR